MLLQLTLWDVRCEMWDLVRSCTGSFVPWRDIFLTSHFSPHWQNWGKKVSLNWNLLRLPLSSFFLSNVWISEESQLRELISDIIIPYRCHQLCQCSCWRCLLLFSRETFLFINTWNYKNYKRLQSLQYTIYNEGNKTFKCSSSESLFYILQVVHA